MGDTAAERPGGSRAWRSRWTFLTLCSLCYWTGTQSLRPMVALRLEELGSGDALIGAVLGLHSFATFLVAVPSGRMVDRVGLRRALVVGLAGMVVAGALFTAVRAVWHLAVVLVAAGLAELSAWVSMQALASHAGTGRHLRRHLALFSFAWGAGLAAGPALGSLVYARYGFASVGALYGGLGAVGLLAALLLPRLGREAPGGRDPVPVAAAVRTMWGSAEVRSVLLSSFVILFVYGIRNSFYPLLLQRQGISLSQIGLLLSTIGIASLAIRLPLPLLVNRVGPERMLTVSMWLAIVAMTVTPWLGSMWLYLPAAIAVGVGVGVNPPVTVELMALHTSARQRGLAMGLRVSSNRLSQMVQPVLFGAVAATVGMPLAFAAGGILLGAMAIAAHPRPA